MDDSQVLVPLGMRLIVFNGRALIEFPRICWMMRHPMLKNKISKQFFGSINDQIDYKRIMDRELGAVNTFLSVTFLSSCTMITSIVKFLPDVTRSKGYNNTPPVIRGFNLNVEVIQLPLKKCEKVTLLRCCVANIRGGSKMLFVIEKDLGFLHAFGLQIAGFVPLVRISRDLRVFGISMQGVERTFHETKPKLPFWVESTGSNSFQYLVLVGILCYPVRGFFLLPLKQWEMILVSFPT